MLPHDPSVLETGAELIQETPVSQQVALQKKEGNGHSENFREQQIEIGPEGKLTKAGEPTLTAPPEDIVYPEDRTAVLQPPEGVAAAVQPLQIRRLVSGSYSGTAGGFRLDLRVDIDRTGALNTASFDFFSIGAVTNYFGSYRLSSPLISYTSTKAVINSGFVGTKAVWANRVRIEIKRNLIFSPAAPAVVTFFRNNVQGAIYSCSFAGPYFRSVLLETDYETGTSLFGDYDTASLPCPPPSRVLNTVKAYGEAGVNMVLTGKNNSVTNNEAGPDARWTETEMHASMIKHFSKFSNLPQWAVWLFAAKRATSSTLLGIMFDYLPNIKPHRQGCAVFQDTIKNYHPTTADYNRHLLYTYVHELGHAFNLLHSWDKSRPDSLSWMNYDWLYDQRNGFGSYWNNFSFIFDSGELLHLRHGFRNNVIMGGSDWAVGAGLEHGEVIDIFTQDMIQNNTGLQLEIEPVKKSFIMGEPVVVEVKLRCMDMNGRVVNANIHPRYDQVRVGIMKPNGKIVAYEPVAHNCVLPKEVQLTKEDNTAYASAYIGYGKEGFYFDQPGFYRIKAAYRTFEGSIIQSEEISIRVKSPVTATEDEIADKYFTTDAGMLFYLLGSDAETLKEGMEDFKLVSEKYKNNPLSIYAEMVIGVNEAMKFKVVDPEINKVVVRKRNLTAAKSKLGKVISASKGNEGVDNITLNWLYRHLAKGYLLEGDEKTAKSTLKEMEDTFKAKKLKPAVMQTISKQASSVMKQS
jgi:hypothetical protein